MNKKDKNRLTDIEKFCLDAWMMNHNADLAYTISRGKPITATPENLHRLALRWLRSDHVKEYLAERGAIAISQAEGYCARVEHIGKLLQGCQAKDGDSFEVGRPATHEGGQHAQG